MTKGAKKAIVLALILLTICLYLISGTYARYASEITGNATAQVAKWSVVFKDGDTELSNDFKLAFKVDENNFVVANKIAPETTATAKIQIDLTGTEVAVDCVASIAEGELERIFGDSATSVDVEATVTGVDGNGTINLVNNTAFTAENGIYDVTITLTWNNVDTNNVSDTNLGIDAQTLEIPVTITAQQHI